ncbi:Uncharacterized protein YydD, contains DUF2326 domain [Halanaerobium congolense]|jgi:uncharacterized protein YydD (DUF2326 family)|uniref:Uncharacterized protein YydD, contains DUF2326 domain n=1 Tax=Halanaerobium congolense TaxID=54121 RepID=A0A1H9ZRA9_9FIRM|nr:DUF2326 domain-containing protein [Halanaerobium congolense]PTX16354.1 uncharacterized protein YydD (DUF2326 family) [Halanaerobium congolense]SDF15846.1 Uncharacterized protein YydD, contains DUF2326 domain [Halanaerobium congolense]SES84197.1 Uncharacterized protein YydD, contains DUF2326 domain [Halanaerobium congolense]SFP45074.1 Uncharacterized protein YydD, contains DUF2326 domain [Halanaerobium congolense]
MKISKIYSNDNRFEDIDFNDGLNIVLGKITNKENLDSDSHNLGKSTLIELIDFLFLKELKKGHFIKDNYSKFKNHIFFMELKLDEAEYITIKRGVSNNTKIYLKRHKNSKQNYVDETDWDYDKLPLTSNQSDKNPKEILNKLIGFNEILSYNYRKYITYFLRTQYDYDKVFKLSKFRGKDKSWKPALVELLGFDGKLVNKKYEYEKEINDKVKLIKDMEAELNITIGDLNKLRTLKEAKKKKRDEVAEKLDNFDFYFKERDLNKELVEDVETKISKLNTQEYNLKYDISQIKDSLNKNNNFDKGRVKKLFKEMNIYFPDQLEKSYDQLIAFNKKITEERSDFLKINLQKKKKQLNNILFKLEELNNKRNEILSVLKEKDSFAKFKKYQSQLVELENEISEISNKLDNLDKLQKISDKKQKLEAELEEVISKEKLEFGSSNRLYESIQSTFTDLVDKILDETAILYYEINNSDNIEFKAKITTIDEDKLTSKSEGYSYKKMLCVCFDLAVLINYNDKRFFEFTYHDGSFESMSDTKKIRYLDTIREICDKYDIQYILTALEDDIPRTSEGDLYEIKGKEVCITLDDREKDEGRLFGFSF